MSNIWKKKNKGALHLHMEGHKDEIADADVLLLLPTSHSVLYQIMSECTMLLAYQLWI
jgi:hypothetical protein